jgi:hypothetical protein
LVLKFMANVVKIYGFCCWNLWSMILKFMATGVAIYGQWG